MTSGSLMRVESIAECGILQYFWPALNDYKSWNHFLVFLSVAVLHGFLQYSPLKSAFDTNALR